jgi:predicted amidohydrolase
MCMYLQVDAFQGPIHESYSKVNLEKILEQTELAEKRGIDILCFPESYLHGYFAKKDDALKHSINLQSEAFSKLCKKFSQFYHRTISRNHNHT